MVSVHSIEFEAHLKILKPSAIYLRRTDFIFTTRICCCLFFSLNICFCGGRAKYQLITWNYHVFLRNFGDQPTPCRWAPRRGFAIAAGREEGAPRLCILTAAATSKWRDRPESAELQSYINGRHDMKNDVKICEILRGPTLISKASSKASSLQRYLQSWCKYPFVTMMSQLFAQQKATNPHGGAANHQVLRSPKGCGSVEIAGASEWPANGAEWPPHSTVHSFELRVSPQAMLLDHRAGIIRGEETIL